MEFQFGYHVDRGVHILLVQDFFCLLLHNTNIEIKLMSVLQRLVNCIHALQLGTMIYVPVHPRCV